MYGYTKHTLIAEDIECIRNWNAYASLDRLPYECGYTVEPYPEDVQAIITMKRWSEQRQEKERKKQEMKRRVQEKVKGLRTKN
jgi:hypothetical protein